MPPTPVSAILTNTVTGYTGSAGNTGSVGYTGSSGAYAAMGYTGSVGGVDIHPFMFIQGI